MAPDYALLGLLARRPATGYDLGRWLRKDGIFLGRRANMSPIYRALADLTERGWIEATVDRRDTGPDGKVYSLTEAGEEALIDWAREPFVPAPRPMDPAFVVRLNFAGQLGVDYALDIVRTELDYRIKQRADEGGPFSGSTDVDPVPSIEPDWLAYIDWLTHSRGWASTSLYISWLELTERELTLIKQNGGRPAQLRSPFDGTPS
ncbi:PadR family transcriptional regulator [Kribbella sp. NPDC059898]|uniref:PadR family transcriptional regulator n=1 Tax=Kribbella sp. NPDC059898 TaxID=3346995 RepID=UPI00365AEDDA